MASRRPDKIYYDISPRPYERMLYEYLNDTPNTGDAKYWKDLFYSLASWLCDGEDDTATAWRALFFDFTGWLGEDALSDWVDSENVIPEDAYCWDKLQGGM